MSNFTNINEINESLDALFDDVLAGKVQLSHANTAARVMGVRSKMMRKQIDVAKETGTTDKLKSFYDLEVK